MFRRTSKTETPTPSPTDGRVGTKGRPTPSRKEAQAAARERAKAALDTKGARRAAGGGGTSSAEIRAGMRNGDERYLPARDKGPVRRFVRNFVDSRLSIAEFLLPLLVVIMALQYSGQRSLLAFSNALWGTLIIVVVLDTLWLVYRLKRKLREKFPDEDTKGTTFYAVTRVLQLRVLRMPKPQVKIGGAPRVKR